jgi:hypothetical protein
MVKTNKNFLQEPDHFNESFTPRYDLVDDEVIELSHNFFQYRKENEQLLSDQYGQYMVASGYPYRSHDRYRELNEALLSRKYGCYILAGGHPCANLARHIERKVFEDSFGNTAPIMEEEYGFYEHASTFFLIMDHEEILPVAAMRIIHDSPVGLKSLEDLPFTDICTSDGDAITPEMVYAAYNIEPDECVDVATAAVARDHRMNGIPALLLYRTLYLTIAADQTNYSHIVAIMDTRAERALKKMKMPFRPILDSQPFSYLDTAADEKSNNDKSLSRAIIARTPDFRKHLMYWQEIYEKRAGSLKRQTGVVNAFGEEAEEIIRRGHVEVDEIETVRKSFITDAKRQAAKYKVQAKAMRALVAHDNEAENSLELERMLSPEILAIGQRNIAALDLAALKQ